MFLQLLIISLVLVAVAFVGLAFNILFTKKGKFPDTSVGHNPEMKKRGITCAKSDELREFNMRKDILKTRKSGYDPTEFSGGCSGCNCH